jgi:hypothetical protein
MIQSQVAMPKCDHWAATQGPTRCDTCHAITRSHRVTQTQTLKDGSIYEAPVFDGGSVVCPDCGTVTIVLRQKVRCHKCWIAAGGV